MIESKNMDDFVDKGNLNDLHKILHKDFNNALLKYEADEIVNAFVCKCIKNKTIERFDPLRNILFSTYMYTCFRNHIFAMCFENKPKQKVLDESHNLYALNDNHPHFSIEQDYSYEHDMKVIENHVNELYKNDVRKANPRILFRMTREGHNDTDIGRVLKVTSSNVGFIKKELIKELRQHYSNHANSHIDNKFI